MEGLSFFCEFKKVAYPHMIKDLHLCWMPFLFIFISGYLGSEPHKNQANTWTSIQTIQTSIISQHAFWLETEESQN